MKKKLQNDLKALKKLWIKIMLSVLIGVIATFICESGDFDLRGNKVPYSFLAALLTFVVLYLFVAWLYGDEKTEKS